MDWTGARVLRLPTEVSIPESGFCLFGPCIFVLEGDFVGVSIPESGFCLFGLYDVVAGGVDGGVSIPESGFCLFGPGWTASTLTPYEFQSLSRDSVCLDFTDYSLTIH